MLDTSPTGKKVQKELRRKRAAFHSLICFILRKERQALALVDSLYSVTFFSDDLRYVAISF